MRGEQTPMPQHAPQYASPADAERLARDWTKAQLSCRLYGHIWQPLRATFHQTYRYFSTVQLCPRCKSERHAELNERGHVVSTAIHYPKGYLAEKVGRIVGDSKDALRLVALARVYDVQAITDPDARARSRAGRELEQGAA